ncbi:MAG TPA: hypothetical protein VEP94_01845 [Solirubrobacterales bacterium]|nr:hypothetical protein [Solirubrobacterales bacterium]
MPSRAKQRREGEEREAEERDRADEALLIALVLILLSPLPFLILSRRVVQLLAAAGIPAPSTLLVLGIIGAAGVKFSDGRDDLGPDLLPDEGPAVATMRRNAVGRRARYILAAVRRVSEGGSEKAERSLFGAHLRAEEGRIEGARRIDRAAAKWGPILGWRATRDNRTTPECFASHGGNFSALVPPSIGWPGTLHGGNCRCEAVAPWPGATMLP